MDRTHPDWAVRFCRDYFGIGDSVVDVMGTAVGAEILFRLWQDLGDQIYESRLYLLREELYRSHSDMAKSHRMPEFFDALPEDGIILDYGCGTAEYARQHWYDKGRRAHLYDVSENLRKYLFAKYHDSQNVILDWFGPMRTASYDGIICLDVLEHIPAPIHATMRFYDMLKPGGHFLVFFCPQRNIPGHLDESIDQIPAWMEWLKERFGLVKEQNGLLWLQKKD